MKCYKIVTGFRDDEYIEINEDELAKAQYLFLEGGGRGLFSGGAVRGQDIIRIVPDWNRVKGWNKGYKLQVEDYVEIRPLERSYRDTYNQAKDVVTHVISTGKKELLNQPLSESSKLIGESSKLMLG